MKDLWRTAIMKFYSKVLGGRDYSLLEAVHFGLKLPATISSFGEVRSVSISDWSVVKPADMLKYTKRGERATFKNKREIFDHRCDLIRPNTVSEDDSKNLSMYAFWRLFDVVKARLVRKQKEQFVALSGTGWPQHAKCVENCKKGRGVLQENTSCIHALPRFGRHVLHRRLCT